MLVTQCGLSSSNANDADRRRGDTTWGDTQDTQDTQDTHDTRVTGARFNLYLQWECARVDVSDTSVHSYGSL